MNLRVILDNHTSNFDLFIFGPTKYKINLDNLIRKYVIKNLQNKNMTMRDIINNFEVFVESKPILKEICGTIKINKSTIIIKQNYDDYLKFILLWNLISRYAYIIRKKFKKVSNEYYMITNAKEQINIEIMLEIKMINVIIIIFKNFKDVYKIIKLRRRKKKNGTSNL